VGRIRDLLGGGSVGVLEVGLVVIRKAVGVRHVVWGRIRSDRPIFYLGQILGGSLEEAANL
jgi:hypothetical protein